MSWSVKESEKVERSVWMTPDHESFREYQILKKKKKYVFNIKTAYVAYIFIITVKTRKKKVNTPPVGRALS